MLNADEVLGFKSLSNTKKLFIAFLKNFYASWGSEARETIVPIRVSFEKNSYDGAYLKFDYEINGRKEWLHIKGSNCWY